MLNARVKDLDVSRNQPGESAQELLSATLKDRHREITELRLAGWKLGDKSCEMLACVLQSANSLTELDLSDNNLRDSGVQFLSKGLSSPHCILQTLRLNQCHLSKTSCKHMASVLQRKPSHLRELDMSGNDLQDEGVELLCVGLRDPQCKLEILRLNQCHLSKTSCKNMASVLQRTPSHLRELDMSGNDLQDEGVELLCEGLRDPQCKLEMLRLSNAGVSDKGFFCLAVILLLNPCVKDLDVSHNQPGESAQELLSAIKDPHREIKELRLAGWKLGDTSCEMLACVLQSANSLTELDLSDNNLRDPGVQFLSKGLSSPHCILQTLRVAGCKLSDKCCKISACSLQSANTQAEQCV
ncbi:ribonuclease inhibitor-like [Sardina pilchardus]|uniref:ribonuclease inhibitor-like n=1 Tax=Sardina pilchardus TaxID=27697 RepID=UPI002E102DEE